MKEYQAKTLELALEEASKDLGIEVENISYVVLEEKKSLFRRYVKIGVTELIDVVDFAENYIRGVCEKLGLDVSLKSFTRDDIIKILIETNHNSILIGKNGSSLQALNELTKLAVSCKFEKKYRILLDIGDYKDKKYGRVIILAKKAAKEVLKTHVDIKLDPMTPDERKKVHNALASWKNIKTESIGDGKDRAVVVKYVPSNDSIENIEENNSAEDNSQEKSE